jgi:hypothetical protein
VSLTNLDQVAVANPKTAYCVSPTVIPPASEPHSRRRRDLHFPDALAFAGASKPLPQVRQDDVGAMLRYEVLAQKSPPALAFRAREIDIDNIEFAQRKGASARHSNGFLRIGLRMHFNERCA